MSDQRVPLPGSAPNMGVQPRWSAAVDPNEKASVTITLRRQQSPDAADLAQQLLSGQARSMSREQAEQATSADPQDMAAVKSFLEEHGLTVTEENPAARTLKAAGTAQQMGEAFSTRIGWFQDSSGNRHLGYEGPLSIPKGLEGIIASVIGLDQRRAATHRSYEGT